MKKVKFLAVVLCLVFIGAFAFACGGDKDVDATGYVVFESEGIDYTGLSGRGSSNEARGTQMIQGQNTRYIREDSKLIKSISGGYFTGFFTTADTALTFNINADAESTENSIILRLGSEFSTMKINKDILNVMINDVALDYSEISVSGTAIVDGKIGYKVPFKDYTLSGKFKLNNGKNVIKLIIRENSLGIIGSTIESVGPGVDCIKIKSTAKLTWDSLWEDNFLEIVPEP